MKLIVIPAVAFSFFLNQTTAYASDDSSGISFGMSLISAPKYSGSNEQRWTVAPDLALKYGDFFIDSADGIGYHLQGDNGLYINSSVNYSSGRSDKNTRMGSGSDKLKGMGKIDSAINTRIALGWAATHWLALEIEANAPLSDSQGLNYKTSSIITPFENKTDSISFETGVLFGDARYVNTWYGVNHKQSIHSGYREFNTSGGIYSFDTSVSWNHIINEHWSTTAGYSYTRLTGHISNSPIVQRKGGSMIILGANYLF